MIVAFDGRVFDRAGKLDHLFEPAVGNIELIMGDPFAANTIAARSAEAQKPAVERHLDVSWLNPRQIDFHDPAISGSIHVGRGTPQASRRSLITRALDRTKVTLKRFAGHKDISDQKSLKVSGENRMSEL